MSEQRLSALQQYLTSLTPYNPSWYHTNHEETTDQQEDHHISFSGRLQLEYTINQKSEVHRSLCVHGDGEGARCGAPVKLEISSDCGRHLVASRNITAGQEVFREAPLVITPRNTPEPFCLACLRALTQDWKGCGCCGAPLCSPKCPGTQHTREECQVLAGMDLGTPINLQELNEMLTPLRTIQVLESNRRLQGVVAAMQSNLGQRKRLHLGEASAKRIATALGEDAEVVGHILGAFDTNAFTVTYSDGGGKGRALLPLSALMNHNCIPNTQHWFHSGVIIVRAVCDIPIGTEVTNNYTPTLWGTSARAIHLAASKLFRCACIRCQDPTELGSHLSSVACHSCRSGLLVPPATPRAGWVCDCGADVGSGAIDAVVRGAAGTVRRARNEDDIDGLNEAVKHLTRVLGATHYVTREATHGLLLASLKPPLSVVNEGDLDRAVIIARDLLGVADLIDPGLSRFRGVLLLELARASTELMRRQFTHSFPDFPDFPITESTPPKNPDTIDFPTTESIPDINSPTDFPTTESNSQKNPNTIDFPTTESTPPKNPDNIDFPSSKNHDSISITVSPANSKTSQDFHITNNITNSSNHTKNNIQTTYSDYKDNIQTTAGNFEDENITKTRHRKYELDSVEKLIAAVEESELILKFDSRLPDVTSLKQQLLEMQRKQPTATYS